VASNEGIFDGTIELRVYDRTLVTHVMELLKKIDGLQEVTDH
jgi:GTP pyrophosphokinase